jgi:hypothetical protein
VAKKIHQRNSPSPVSDCADHTRRPDDKPHESGGHPSPPRLPHNKRTVLDTSFNTTNPHIRFLAISTCYRLAASYFTELARRSFDDSAKDQKQINIKNRPQKKRDNRTTEEVDQEFLSSSPTEDERCGPLRVGISPRPLAPFEDEEAARECPYDPEHHTA